MEVPARAKDRPTYKGLLVPYTVRWYGDVPDFKIPDARKIKRCVLERRCGLCGKHMDREVVFIGGELSIQNRLFTDPAMHEACARYAMTVCPFLTGAIEEMAPEERIRPDATIDRNASPIRPKRFGLLFTDGWTLKPIQNEVYIHGNSGRIEWLSEGA